MKRGVPWLVLAVVAVVGCGSSDESSSESDGKVDCDAALTCGSVQADAGQLAASADVTCFLEAQRDRKPGRYQYVSGGISAATTYSLWILADGTGAIATGVIATDAGLLPALSHYELKPPSHFEACLAAITDEDRFTCAFGNVQAKLASPVTCR
jgi:hypothetical protein